MGLANYAGESSKPHRLYTHGRSATGSAAQEYEYTSDSEQYRYESYPFQTIAGPSAPQNQNSAAFYNSPAPVAAPSTTSTLAYSSSSSSSSSSPSGRPFTQSDIETLRDDDSTTTYSSAAPGNHHPNIPQNPANNNYPQHNAYNDYNDYNAYNAYHHHPIAYATPLTQASLNTRPADDDDEQASPSYRDEQSRRLRHAAQDLGVPYYSRMSRQVGHRSDGMMPAERFWDDGAGNLPARLMVQSHPPRHRDQIPRHGR